MSFIITYVTHPNLETAESIAKSLIERRIIACANFFPISSTYWWKGDMENTEEIVSLLKTRKENWELLQAEVQKLHPYETPCIMRMDVTANEEYEKWILDETLSGRPVWMKTLLVDAYNTFVLPDHKGIDVKMFQMLENYPNRKIVLTNADDEEIVSLGIDASPYEIFSLKHRPNKTDPEYHKTMLAYFRLNPDEVLYFEHNAEAVASARSLGIETFQYDSENRNLRELKEFIDSNF